MDPFLEFLKESKQVAEKGEHFLNKNAVARKKSADEPYKLEKKNTKY